MKEIYPEVDCVCKPYCSVMICGATEKEFVTACEKMFGDKADYICYNGFLNDDGSITCDFCKEEANYITQKLSILLPDATVYGDCSWDYHYFCSYKNGRENDDFTARWKEEEPEGYKEWDEEDEETYFDCNIVITDNKTGCEFYTGGGMCEEKEYKAFCVLINSHPYTKQNEEVER